MKEINAQEFEIKFFQLTEEMKNDRIEAIKLVNQELATKMIGGRGKVHKAIREALEKDAELKARYEAILADVKDPNKS